MGQPACASLQGQLLLRVSPLLSGVEGAPLNCSRGSRTPTSPSLQILASEKMIIFSTAVWVLCGGQVYMGSSRCWWAFWRWQGPRGLRPSLPLHPAALMEQPSEVSCHLELTCGRRWQQAPPCCFEDASCWSCLGKEVVGFQGGSVVDSASSTRVQTQMGVEQIKAEKIINVARDEESLGDIIVQLGHKAWKRLLGAPGVGEEGAGLKERRPRPRSGPTLSLPSRELEGLGRAGDHLVMVMDRSKGGRTRGHFHRLSRVLRVHDRSVTCMF